MSTKQKSARTVEVRVLVDFWLGEVRQHSNTILVLDPDAARNLASQGLVDIDPAAVAAARAEGA